MTSDCLHYSAGRILDTEFKSSSSTSPPENKLMKIVVNILERSMNKCIKHVKSDALKALNRKRFDFEKFELRLAKVFFARRRVLWKDGFEALNGYSIAVKHWRREFMVGMLRTAGQMKACNNLSFILQKYVFFFYCQNVLKLM